MHCALRGVSWSALSITLLRARMAVCVSRSAIGDGAFSRHGDLPPFLVTTHLVHAVPMDKTKQVPAHALRFDASDIALAPAANGQAARTFEGVAYSGQVVSDHYFWGNVVFDLASVQAPERLPILIEHDRGQRAGFASAEISDAIRVSGTLLDNQHGQAVASEADAGFPWQMSVHIHPGRVDEIGEGSTIEVNGQTLQGPLTIFRDSLIRETSFTPTGADAHTSARVFSDAEVLDIPISGDDRETNEVNDMTDTTDERLTELQQQLDAANQRAETAEAALSDIKASARDADIRSLFSDIGKEYSDEAAKPYVGMSAKQFGAVAAQLREATPTPPANLFTEQATQGAEPESNPLDFSAIYKARQGARGN